MFDSGFASASDLNRFASREEFRGLLPEVVRRLIKPTPGLRSRNIPGRSGLWRDGPDGIVECDGGDEFVPDGISVWEMSNEGEIAAKAQRDYRNRVANPGPAIPFQTTYVFVTMRNFKRNREWCAQRRADGIWRDVRVYDSEGLCMWLESNLEVHAWASKQLGLNPICETTPAQLPADLNYFFGRDTELRQLDRQVGNPDGRVLVISGQPGVGKTTLAIRFAHEHAPQFPDGQLYVDLRGTHDDCLPPAAALEWILRSFGQLAPATTGSTEELAATYRSIISRKRLILVLDNAASEKQVELLIPGQSRSIVIITSRNPLAGLDCKMPLPLDVLSPDQAAAFLRNQLGKQITECDEGGIKAIADACSGLPLALDIAAKIALQHPSWSLQFLGSRLSDERNRLDSLAIGDLAVRTSFQLSYDLLSKKQKSLFRKITVIPGSTFDASLAAAAVGTKDVRKIENAIERL